MTDTMSKVGSIFSEISSAWTQCNFNMDAPISKVSAVLERFSSPSLTDGYNLAMGALLNQQEYNDGKAHLENRNCAKAGEVYGKIMKGAMETSLTDGLGKATDSFIGSTVDYLQSWLGIKVEL